MVCRESKTMFPLCPVPPHPGPLPREREMRSIKKISQTYPRLSAPSDNALGFRDGRHELSHLCPETSGACPRIGDDIPKLRQGVRPGRGALNDRPHLPGALESVARASGKSPRTGCRRCHVIKSNRLTALADIPFPSLPRRRLARAAPQPCPLAPSNCSQPGV